MTAVIDPLKVHVIHKPEFVQGYDTKETCTFEAGR